MKKIRGLLLRCVVSGYVVFSFIVFPITSHATITSLISYQAKLTDTNNVAVADAAYTVKFRIYGVSSGGSALYAEQQSATTANGLFSALIGSGTLIESSGALGAVDFNQDPLYLGVQIGSDAEMTPRKRIGASVFAFNANKVGGKSETEFALLAGRSGGQTLQGGTASGENLTLQSTANATKGKIFFGASSTYDEVNVRLGIGTSTPSAALDVKGTANIPQLIVRANSTQSNSNPIIQVLTNTGSELFRLHSDDSTNLFLGTSSGNINNAGGGGIHNIFVGSEVGGANTTGASNVGIGWRSLFSNTTGSGNVALGDGALTTNTTGGINTAIGGYALASDTFGGNNTALGSAALRFNTSGSENVSVGFNSLYSNLTGTQNVGLGNQAGYSSLGNGNLFLGYQSGYNETGSNKLYIANNSSTPLIYGDFAQRRVGIGSTNPSSTLDVYLATSTSAVNIFQAFSDVGSVQNTVFRVDTNGNVYADGTFTPGGADLAENYIASDASLESGDIVSFSNQSLGVSKSSVSYDNKLLGIVSKKPGVLLGGSMEKSVPLALSGRVPTKISLKNGSIHIGDPITSSDIAGVGMKATKSGRIIGYALENYEGEISSEIKIILVFANLGYHLGDDVFGGGGVSSGSFSGMLTNALASFTGTVKATGTWVFDKIQTSFLGTKYIQVENGVTMKDKITGDYYCLTLQNGEITKMKGTCEQLDTPENTSSTSSVPVLSNSTATSTQTETLFSETTSTASSTSP
ncbi:MAG: hypothetical protein HZA35_03795 [Parcubacteria group bacterium]|nr:hypothetical protein [Parcubacteria group bacterium]